MTPGHTIEITLVGETHAAIMKLADRLLDSNDEEAMVVVRDTDATGWYPGMAAQSYCESCHQADSLIPGLFWPATPAEDDTREWVTRCDTCQRYPDDQAAARRVVEFYEGSGAPIDIGTALPAGSTTPVPYVTLLDLEPRAAT